MTQVWIAILDPDCEVKEGEAESTQVGISSDVGAVLTLD